MENDISNDWLEPAKGPEPAPSSTPGNEAPKEGNEVRTVLTIAGIVTILVILVKWDAITDFGRSPLKYPLILLFAVAFFLLIRQLNLWYWKINKAIAQRNETNALLKEILQELRKEKK